MGGDYDNGGVGARYAGIAKDLEVLEELGVVAKGVLGTPQQRLYERTLRFLGIAMVNSSVAVGMLCTAGFGADAAKIARSVFEAHVTFRYLLRRPNELRDFIDFDAVARYNRLQFYKSKMPHVYATFPTEKMEATNNAYRTVKKRFADSTGKVRKRWSGHSLAEMARVAELADLYDLFYRYASSLHHTDPMGLAMLVDRETLDIQPGPTERHVRIGIRIATSILHEAILEYSKLIGVDCSEPLRRIGDLISDV